MDVADDGLVGRDAGIAHGGALGPGGEKGGTPVVDPAMGEGGADGDKGGQVGILRAEPVADPGAEAGADEGVAPGVQLEQGTAVGRVGAVEAAHDAEVIHALGHMGKEVADRQAALAILFELPGRLQQGAGLGKGDAGQRKGERFAMIPVQ